MEELRILVVDDDEVDRLAVLRALRQAALGASLVVEEADSAESARRVLASGAIDCVLLDLRLPGTTGLELLGSLRAENVRAPVVMLTGQGDEQTAVEAMKAGAADYLTKAALEPGRLAQSIRHALRVRDAEREAAIARARLEEAEQRYRFLADSIPQMVWVDGSDLAAEYVNRQFMEYTGMTLDEVQRQTWFGLVHPDDLADVVARWSEVEASHARFEVQARLRRHDGRYRWHLNRAEAHRGNDGVVRWFGTSTDIEEQKATEAELLRLKDTAERERLRAEESNRAKDDFLAVLSHELRTPLNSILGWISILRGSDTASDTIARALAIIDRSARTQTQLIEDLLDVSRIVAGKLVLEKRIVDVGDVVSAALETVQPLAAAKNVTFETKLASEPLVVSGDAARLQQVVWNLLVNAVKFSPDGGRIILEARHDGRRVVVTVADSGEGIDPAFLPHVFDRFRQADSSSSRGQGGLGLGLSIVHHLVERHGGTIVATSAGRGKGATFTVSLPSERATMLTAVPAMTEPADDSLASVDVLVVDDDDDSREMLVAALERHGASIRSARSVADARDELAVRLPDVIVSDLGMPDEDGYTLIAEIRRRPRDSGGAIPAIALTGYAGLEDQRRARAAGFDQHISKPVDLTKLPRIIARLLAARRADDERPPTGEVARAR